MPTTSRSCTGHGETLRGRHGAQTRAVDRPPVRCSAVTDNPLPAAAHRRPHAATTSCSTPDLGAATFARRGRHRPRRRTRPRRRARAATPSSSTSTRRGRRALDGASAVDAASPLDAGDRARSRSPSPRAARGRRRSTLHVALPRHRSTTSCAASTARTFKRRRRRRRRSSPPPRCRPPTAGGPSRAGTSPTSRPSSASRSSSPTTCSPSRTGPRSSREPDAATARSRVAFADTMLMSTYLVAFVVGPLEATDADRRRRRAAARRARARQGPPHRRSPSRSAPSRCAGSSEYYGIPYPSDKVDLVALPDFAAGAMENLGLHHLPRGRCSSSTRATARRPRSSASPTSSPTSWPTCGSATSSRCGGGTASG